MPCLPTLFLFALGNPLTMPTCTHHHTHSKAEYGNDPEPNFPFPTPKGYFPFVMVYELIIFEAHFQIQFWYLKGYTYIHMYVQVCVCVHTLLCYKKQCLSIHSDATFSGSFFSSISLIMLTCFMPHLGLLYTWQTKSSIYHIFWQNTFFLWLDSFLCILALVGNKLKPEVHTPRWKGCSRNHVDLLPGIPFLLRTTPKTVTWASQVESVLHRMTLFLWVFKRQVLMYIDKCSVWQIKIVWSKMLK